MLFADYSSTKGTLLVAISGFVILKLSISLRSVYSKKCFHVRLPLLFLAAVYLENYVAKNETTLS